MKFLPLVWAMLGAALRFIPYVGPVLAAGAPILVSLAALHGWRGPLEVMGLFTVLELFTNLVLETVLTFFLMFVITAVATDARAVTRAAAFAIGGTVGLEALFAGPISGLMDSNAISSWFWTAKRQSLPNWPAVNYRDSST